MIDSAEKQFDAWNIVKKNLQGRLVTPSFHQRKIWWCALGVNIGFEQDGQNKLFERPVLVIRKFSNDVLFVLPLTKTEKESPFYYVLPTKETLSRVILTQGRLISSKRLLRKMMRIPDHHFQKIKQQMFQLLS